MFIQKSDCSSVCPDARVSSLCLQKEHKVLHWNEKKNFSYVFWIWPSSTYWNRNYSAKRAQFCHIYKCNTEKCMNFFISLNLTICMFWAVVRRSHLNMTRFRWNEQYNNNFPQFITFLLYIGCFSSDRNSHAPIAAILKQLICNRIAKNNDFIKY